MRVVPRSGERVRNPAADDPVIRLVSIELARAGDIRDTDDADPSYDLPDKDVSDDPRELLQDDLPEGLALDEPDEEYEIEREDE